MRKATKEGVSAKDVSVKSSKQKRKVGQTADEVYEEALGDRSRKKSKKGKRSA